MDQLLHLHALSHQRGPANSNAVEPRGLMCHCPVHGTVHPFQFPYTPKRTVREVLRKRICYNHTQHRTDFTIAPKPLFLQRCKESPIFKSPSSTSTVSSQKRFALQKVPAILRSSTFPIKIEGIFVRVLFSSLFISVHRDKALLSHQRCPMIQSSTRQPEIIYLTEHKIFLHQS